MLDKSLLCARFYCMIDVHFYRSRAEKDGGRNSTVLDQRLKWLFIYFHAFAKTSPPFSTEFVLLICLGSDRPFCKNLFERLRFVLTSYWVRFLFQSNYAGSLKFDYNEELASRYRQTLVEQFSRLDVRAKSFIASLCLWTRFTCWRMQIFVCNTESLITLRWLLDLYYVFWVMGQLFELDDLFKKTSVPFCEDFKQRFTADIKVLTVAPRT